MDNEFLPDLYELEDENGNKQTFELLDAMEYGDEKYYALTPYYENGDEALEDSGDVVILKAEYDENNDEILASIEDDDEYEKIGQMFMERIDEMFEFDDEDDELDYGDEYDEEETLDEYDEEETLKEEKPRREKPKAGKKPASGFSIFLLAIMVLLLLFLLICLVVMLMKCGIIPGADSHFVRSFAIWFNSHLFPLF